MRECRRPHLGKAAIPNQKIEPGSRARLLSEEKGKNNVLTWLQIPSFIHR